MPKAEDEFWTAEGSIGPARFVPANEGPGGVRRP